MFVLGLVGVVYVYVMLFWVVREFELVEVCDMMDYWFRFFGDVWCLFNFKINLSNVFYLFCS